MARTARLAATLVAVAIIATLLALEPAAAVEPVPLTGPAGTASVVEHEPPVDAPVVAVFRLPDRRWEAGNRGIDYDTPAGTDVVPSAPGTVTFAGFIGRHAHVVVLHADGLRTSYSFLASLSVSTGARVGRTTVLGQTAGPLHFGVRAGDVYLDPLAVLAGGAYQVELIEDRWRSPGSPSAERRSLIEALGSRIWQGTAGAGRAVAWVGGTAVAGVGNIGAHIRAQIDDLIAQIEIWAHQVAALDPTSRLAAIGSDLVAWYRERSDCTPQAVAPPTVQRDRVVVLVGGLGAGAAESSITRLDTASLGYDDANVIQFSYRGGAVAGPGAEGLEHNDYDAADTTADLWTSGDRLRALLAQIRVARPGATVDLVGHSQGGLVIRAALDGDDSSDPRIPPLGAIVTVATPHLGADAATAHAGIGLTTIGGYAFDALGAAGLDADVVGHSIAQMAETSDTMAALAERDLPAGVAVTSVAASGDLAVAAPNSRLRGARNAVVEIGGTSAHDRVVTAAAGHREIALGLAGLAPTCRTFGRALRSTLSGHGISMATDGVGLVASGALTFLEGRVGGGPPTKTPGPLARHR